MLRCRPARKKHLFQLRLKFVLIHPPERMLLYDLVFVNAPDNGLRIRIRVMVWGEMATAPCKLPSTFGEIWEINEWTKVGQVVGGEEAFR